MAVRQDAGSTPEFPPLVAKSVETTYNVLPEDDVIFADASAGNFAVILNGAADRDRPLVVKRVDNRNDTRVHVYDTAHGLDGSHGVDITLSATSAFGAESGESVTLLFDADDDTWRISSLQNTSKSDLQRHMVIEGTRSVTPNFSHVAWSNRWLAIGRGYDEDGDIAEFVNMAMPAVGATIPVTTGGEVTVTADGIPLGPWQTLWYDPGPSGDTNVGSYFILPFTDQFIAQDSAVWIAKRVASQHIEWADRQRNNGVADEFELTARQLQQLGCAPTTVGLTDAAFGAGPHTGWGAGSAPVGWKHTNNGSVVINGMVPVVAGRCVHFWNPPDGVGTVTWNHRAGTGANRLNTPGGNPFVLEPGEFVTWAWDSAEGWVVVGGS